MEPPPPARRSFELSPRAIFLIGLLVQASLLIPLWGHTSASTAFLGRYSLRYGAALVLSLALTGGWLGLVLLSGRVALFLQRLPESVMLGALVVTGAGLALVWQSSFETVMLRYFTLNWLLMVVALALVRPDRALVFKRWPYLVLGVALVALIPLGITAMTYQRFSPDEAHWADMATTYFVEGGVYSRTWYHPPLVIQPGLPWSVVAYGWVLEHVHFAQVTGRLWNFAGYLLAFVGVGLLTNHLYGRRAAALSVSVAIMSQIIIPVYDYRPDHQLVAVGPFLLLLVLKGRAAPNPLRGAPWHITAGLLATLSLNIHAAGIVFAVGLSLFYLADYAFGGWGRSRTALVPLVGFGLGAMLGTGCYYLFNIHPVGGLGAYLDTLVSLRWSTQRRLLRILALSSLDRVIVVAGLIYLLWRRRTADRLFLGLLGSLFVSALLVDTQGYHSPFSALLVVPTGTLLLEAFGSPPGPRGMGLRSALIGGAAFGVLFVQMMGGFVQWGNVARWVTTGTLEPSVYEEARPVLAPYVDEDDVILGVTGLLWTFPDHPAIVNYGAETTGQARLGVDDPLAVWEIIQPTVVVHLAREMTLSDALQIYMAQEKFVPCLATPIQEQTVTVYRQDCPDAP